MELQLLGPQIIARLNLALGHAMIERLRFIQQAPAISTPRTPRLERDSVTPPDDLPEGALGVALAEMYKGIKGRR